MASFLYDNQKEIAPTATFSKTTSFNGVLHFDGVVCIMGKFNGTIEAKGSLIVGKGAQVDCDHIFAHSITVHGVVNAEIKAEDKVDLTTGSEVHGDISAGRLRIADGVLFEGRCNMIDKSGGIELFSLSTPEIKAALQPDVYALPETTEAPETKDGDNGTF
ncbi:MAG: polymer-forming cytoskeletal protein [Spirochaetaceae bacterium]|jgi:cytoskeletal protein CcmA (bactofilin family)|nr:polymer-forming cytoskeletal protein [Spirochaetaceae bacterium]